MITKNFKLESGQEYTLSQLFNGINRIVIPDLQRDYCWGDKAWNKVAEKHKELVSGFMNSLIVSFIEKRTDKLTLGLIYGYESPHFNIQLCDGQQRITTLFLLLGMINRKTQNRFQKQLITDDELMDDKEPNLLYAIRESTLYFLSDLVCEFFLKEHIKIEDIKNKEWYFNEYDLDSSIQSMINAIKIIDNKLYELNNYNEFGDFLINNLQFLYYDMGHRTRGEETFVIINTTGEPLTATENLKPILIGSIVDHIERNEKSLEWEDREEWFWQNKRRTEHTSDDALNDFFIWYWQIRLLQEKSWKDKKIYPLNPNELFLKKPLFSENDEEIPDVSEWEESISLDTIQRYFVALQNLVEISLDERVEKVLRTILDEDINLSWFRNSNIEIILPLIAYLEKFSNAVIFYKFVRRIRKNFYDNKWNDRKSNYVDWRHIIQIIQFSDTEEQVLKYETQISQKIFKKISKVSLNEWFNEEEKIKSKLMLHNIEIENWENHVDFMGDISFLFSINDKMGLENTNSNFATLQKYYQNYISTINLIRNQSVATETARMSNLFRLFLLYIGCEKVEHKPRVLLEIEGVLFSKISRNHLHKRRFKELVACNEDQLADFCLNYIKMKIVEWNLFEINEHNFSVEKVLKCWLTLKCFKAINENVCLAYYDGKNGDEGVSAYKDINRNKLLIEVPFSINNMICGFATKSSRSSSKVSFTNHSLWLNPDIIDSPFASIDINENNRTVEQLNKNKEEIDKIKASIF